MCIAGRGICYAMLVDLGTTCGRAFSAFTIGVSGQAEELLSLGLIAGSCALWAISPRFAFRKVHLFKGSELLLIEVRTICTLRVMNQI